MLAPNAPLRPVVTALAPVAVAPAPTSAATREEPRHRAAAGGTVKSVPRQDLIPPLNCGILSARAHPANGTLFPQPPVTCAGKTALLDEIAGTALRLMLRGDTDPAALLAGAAANGASTVRFGAPAGLTESAVIDVEERGGVAAAWFAKHGVMGALVRPEHYVFGVAPDRGAVDALLGALRAGIAGGG